MPHPRSHSSRQLYLRLLSYVRPYALAFAVALLAMIFAAATEPLFPMLMKPLLDGGFAQAASGSAAWPPIAFAAAIVGVFLVRGMAVFIGSYFMGWVAEKVVLDLRAAMFARLVRFPTRAFDDQTAGALLSRVAYDVANVSAAATTALTTLVRETIVITGLLLWMLYLNWKLTLIAIVVAPLAAALVRVLSRRLRSMARASQHALGDLVHVLEETIECHRVVKVFGGHDYDDGDGRREATRQRVNAWLREGGAFDATIDFDKAIRDPGEPRRVRPELHVGDGLHLNPSGYRVLADAVPASLFAL